jgi:hypothetical protein
MLESLLPGTLVNARVKKVQENCIVVTVASFYEGTIDAFHVGFPLTDPQNQFSHFKKGFKVNTTRFFSAQLVNILVTRTNPVH